MRGGTPGGAPKEGHNLSTGAGVFRAEFARAYAAGNAIFDGPGYRLGVVSAIFYICKIRCCGRGRSRDVVGEVVGAVVGVAVGAVVGSAVGAVVGAAVGVGVMVGVGAGVSSLGFFTWNFLEFAKVEPTSFLAYPYAV